MGSSFLSRARGPSRRTRAPYLSGSPSTVGRVSNEAITAVGLFWCQPFSTRTPLIVAIIRTEAPVARNKYPEETVEKILDVAERLFVERGYEHTTTI